MTQPSLLPQISPKVSIGLPVYNGERHLREMLESLLAQTFTDFEIVISDNASTDNTPAICAEFLTRDKRIKYHRQASNRGVFANTEFVMTHATGQYFMLAGDDDVYDRSYISTLLPILEKDVYIGLAFSDFGYIHPDGEKISASFNLILTSRDTRFGGLIKFMFRRSALPMMMGLFRIEAVLNALPFAAAELSPVTGDVDNVFLVRILSVCKSANVKDTLFYYRVKDRSGWLPPDWPPTVVRQVIYIFRHHMRVAHLMKIALNKSDFPLIQKASLMAINRISALYLFLRYATMKCLEK